MTTLPPVAGASPSSLPTIGAAKGSTPEPGFRAALDSAAAGLQHPSIPEQPGKSDKGHKSTDKEGDAATAAKQSDPPQGQDVLLNLLVAPPALVPTEPLSVGPSAQDLKPELKQGSEGVPQVSGSADSGLPIGLPKTIPSTVPGSAAASVADTPVNGDASKKPEDKLESIPPGLAARTTQGKLPAAPQPTRVEAQTQPPAGQPSKTVPVNNAGQPGDARAAVHASEGGSAQPVSASQPLPDTPSAPTEFKAADPTLLTATAQIFPRVTAPPVSVKASAGKPTQPGNPVLGNAIGLQKTDPSAAATPFATGGIAQEHGDKANPQSDSAPAKKDSVGDPAPAATLPVQVFAANDSGTTPILASGAAAPAPVLHEAPSGPILSGAPATPQTVAAHAPEPISSAGALPQINTARVLGSMQGTELRVGMHSQEFGSVSIATSVSPGGVAAQIALDHGGLSRALAVHLPGIEEKLGHALGVQARVEVLSGGAGAGQSGDSGSAPREGSRQDRGFSGAPGVSAQEPYLAQAPAEAGEQAGSGLRLSVRA